MAMFSLSALNTNAGMLFISALFGWVIAIGSHPSWQVPVESAQVLAGIVTYPQDNPFYLYHVKLWTLINQFAALLLFAGIPEITASLLMEGVIGAITFSAIFLMVLSISNKPLVSLFTPLFMYVLNLAGISIAYPIYLLGTSHSYGILGLSYTVLVVGLLGVGRYRTGAFLAGLAPAVHPSLGTFCVIISSCTVLLNLSTLRPELFRMSKSFALGVAATAASLWWQSRYFALGPDLDGAQKERYITSFIANFDYHRPLPGWNHEGLLVGILILVTAIRLMRIMDARVGAKIVAAAVASSVVVTVAVVALSDFVPFFCSLKILIPWRYLNFAHICLVPLVFGFLAAASPNLPRLKALLLIVIPIVCFYWSRSGSINPMWFYGGLLLLILLLSIQWHLDIPEYIFGTLSRSLTWITASGCVVLALSSVTPALRTLLSHGYALEDRSTIEIIRIASGRPGILLTAGDMHLVQLMTRRPVLLDGGGLDFFCYVPESGPRLNDIMRKVYGMDIFVSPPLQVRNGGVIPMIHQQLWEDRTVEEWRQLRREFGVTDIFTPIMWNLQLPRIAFGSGLALYEIP